MALFTDGTIARLDDLRAYESAVLDLASGERIDVSAKLKTAQRELGNELISFLAKSGAGVRDLSRIVVTDAMLDAHALRTLELIYRDLYQSRLNDRYEGKWREYAKQSERAVRNLIDGGVGMTGSPLPKPGAPTVSFVIEGLLPARTYYVRIGWTNGRQTGALSDPVSLLIPPGGKLNVDAPAMPGDIIGWVVYAGASMGQALLQTETWLSSGEAWTEAESGLRDDLSSLPIQSPDYFVENGRRLLRG